MSTEKDVRELEILNELSQLLGKAFTIYNKTTGEAFGLDGQSVINIASAAVDKSQDIPLDSGSTTKVPVVAAVEGELNKKVSKSGNETVAGIKTFSSSPLVPTPTANTQTANKKYVDDAIGTKQANLVFGIADGNAVKINAEDVAENDFAIFTPFGVKGLSDAEVAEKLGKGAINGLAELNSNGFVKREQLAGIIVPFMSFAINNNGELIMITPEEPVDVTFRIENGNLIFIIN